MARKKANFPGGQSVRVRVNAREDLEERLYTLGNIAIPRASARFPRASSCVSAGNVHAIPRA